MVWRQRRRPRDSAKGLDNRRHAPDDDLDGDDWAFLVLEEPIGEIAGTMRVASIDGAELARRLAAGLLSAVNQAGYSGDSPHKLTAHEGCAITDVFDDGTFFHDCDAIDGDSGSPIFVADAEGEGFTVLGIMSATYPWTEEDEREMGVSAERFHKTWVRLSGDGE